MGGVWNCVVRDRLGLNAEHLEGHMNCPAVAIVLVLLGHASLALANQTPPTTGPVAAMSAQAATRPAVAHVPLDERMITALMNPPFESLPPELRGEHWSAMTWTLRKRLESATPTDRNALVAQLKAWAVASLRDSDEGMSSALLGSTFFWTGEAATPALLDFLASDPDFGPDQAARLAGVATYAFMTDRVARSRAVEERPFSDVIAGVRMLPQRSLTDGLMQHKPRLIALLRIAADRVDEVNDAGGPDWTPKPVTDFAQLSTFIVVAGAGERLRDLYDELMRLSEGRGPLASDAAVAAAAAVDPKRLADDGAAIEKLRRASGRNPRVAMIAGPAHRDLLADAAVAAMESPDPLQQRSGLMLGRLVIDGDFELSGQELDASPPLAKRMRPAVEKLAASTDPAVRAAAAEANNAIERALMFED